MTPRSYALLENVGGSAFASGELLHITERLNAYVNRLKNGEVGEEAKDELGRKMLLLVGQGIAHLKLVEFELNGVYAGLQRDGDERGEESAVPTLREALL